MRSWEFRMELQVAGRKWQVVGEKLQVLAFGGREKVVEWTGDRIIEWIA